MCPFILGLGFRKDSAEVQVREDPNDLTRVATAACLVDHRAEPWKTSCLL